MCRLTSSLRTKQTQPSELRVSMLHCISGSQKLARGGSVRVVKSTAGKSFVPLSVTVGTCSVRAKQAVLTP